MGRESREQILDRYDVRPVADIEADQQSTPASASYVSNSELRALIDSVGIDDFVAETARRLYWRYLNEPFREVYRAFRETHKGEVDAKGNSATFPEYLPTAEQTQNMEKLVMLLNAASCPKWLEIAELYRELGDMDAATRALSHITGEQERLHFVVEKLVSLKVRGPVKFKY